LYAAKQVVVLWIICSVFPELYAAKQVVVLWIVCSVFPELYAAKQVVVLWIVCSAFDLLRLLIFSLIEVASTTTVLEI
jgi:hypothetical protein